MNPVAKRVYINHDGKKILHTIYFYRKPFFSMLNADIHKFCIKCHVMKIFLYILIIILPTFYCKYQIIFIHYSHVWGYNELKRIFSCKIKSQLSNMLRRNNYLKNSFCFALSRIVPEQFYYIVR